MEGIQVVKAELSHEIEQMELVPLGDLHVGDRWSNTQAIQSAVDYILEEKHRYVVLNGDLINNAIKTSVSDIYTEVISPIQQIEKVVELLTPIKDRILAMGSGNHEERTYKLTGIDPSRYISTRLGIEERYSENSFVLFIKVGKSHSSKPSNIKQQVYSVFVQHGYGGGKKPGSKLNNMVASNGIIADCDLYIVGHGHTPIIHPDSTFVTDVQNMTLSRKDRFYLMHNAYLDFGGYGLRQGFSPASKKITYATLYTQGRKQISVTVG